MTDSSSPSPVVDSEKPPSRVLRQRYQDEYALPLARALFELEPRCESVLFTVGQYWSDEATDAVHGEVFACAEREPTWPEAAQARPGALGDPEELAAVLAEADAGEEPPPLDMVQEDLLRRARERAFGKNYWSALDDNTDMIVAFASYCREVSDQEQPYYRSHTPYGVVRRPAAEEPLRFEVTGSLHRPEWEDRWDVLEHDGIISESASESTRDGSLAPRVVSGSHSQGATAGAALQPFHRVLLIVLFVIAVIAVRACLQR